MTLDGHRLTPTELIRLHIMLETEDVRDDDTMRLVSLVPMVASAAAPAPLPTAAPRAAASVPDHDDRSVALLERSVLALTLWQERMEEV